MLCQQGCTHHLQSMLCTALQGVGPAKVQYKACSVIWQKRTGRFCTVGRGSVCKLISLGWCSKLPAKHKTVHIVAGWNFQYWQVNLRRLLMCICITEHLFKWEIQHAGCPIPVHQHHHVMKTKLRCTCCCLCCTHVPAVGGHQCRQVALTLIS